MPNETTFKARGIRLESWNKPKEKIFEITTSRDIALITGTSNIPLTRKIAREMQEDFAIATGRFSDGDIAVQIPTTVDGRDVFIIQTTPPSANNLMELLIMIQACKLADAKRITAIIPYLYGSRQDRKDAPRTSITARLVADLLETAGATRFGLIDIHAEQEAGFFSNPANIIHARKALIPELKNLELDKPCYLATDIGGDKHIPQFAFDAGANPDTDTATVIKHRENGKAFPKYIQGNVQDRDVVIVDDIANTCHSIVGAARMAEKQGAKNVYAVITHGMMMSGDKSKDEETLNRLMDSPIKRILLTDTIKQPPEIINHPKIKIVSVASLLAKAIQRMHLGEPLSPDLVD